MISIDLKNNPDNVQIDGSLAEVGAQVSFIIDCYVRELLNEGVCASERQAKLFITKMMDIIFEGDKE